MPGKKKPDKKADDVKLVSEPEFPTALSKVLATSKAESDEQMAKFQASNAAKLERRRDRSSCAIMSVVCCYLC